MRTPAQKSGSDPGTTVQKWIEDMQATEDSPVLLIKYQQERATEVKTGDAPRAPCVAVRSGESVKHLS